MGTNKSTLSSWILHGCAVLGIAALIIPGMARAEGPLKLEGGVAPHEQIDDLYRRLSDAVASLDSSGFSSVYAGGVFYLAPAVPLATGLDAVASHWDGWFAWMKEGQGSLEMDFRVVAREVQDDSIGYDVGYYRILQARPDEAEVTYEGKLVVVTKKQADGAWRFQVDAYNSLKEAE